MKRVFIPILTLFSLILAQMWRPEPTHIFGVGVLGFVYLVLAFLLFSIIFWGVYLWLVKGREKKE